MKRNSGMTACNSYRPLTPLCLLSVIVLALWSTAIAQMGQGGGDMMQKVQALKQAAAQNKQQLHQYQWIETRQVTLKGEQKPESVSQCSYGPNGQVQKTPLSAPPQPPQGGRLKQRIIEKKTEEMKDYMQDVQGLLALYVPPNPDLIQQAIQNHNVTVEKQLGAGTANIVFKNYAKPGDQMTVAFNPSTRKISTISVNTYTGQEKDANKDAVTLAIQMASLPDGTNYAQQSVLNVAAKQMQVTTTNSNYSKIQ